MSKDLRDRFLVKPGRRALLKKRDCADTAGYGREEAEAALQKKIAHLFELQYLLAAQRRHSLLVVLQAMDAAGKDGTIRNVMRGLNPQGCHVTSFKVPSEEERDHDFLWRIHRATPRRGEIAIFNRSHYEDVLVVRVRELASKGVWRKRYAQINEFERILAEHETTVVKFFLHVSKGEQAQRIRARLEDPKKNWKYAPADVEERKLWGDYMEAYEDALTRCSTPHAPWYVIPADRKWFRDLAIAEILVNTLNDLKLRLPKPAFDLSKVVI